MKQTKLSVLLASLMAAGFMMSGQALAADNDMATVSAAVVQAISITKNTDMDIGSFYNTASGTVTLKPNNSRVASGPTLIGSNGTAAKFTVTGTNGVTFSIATTGSDSTLAGPDSATMGIAFITSATAEDKSSGTIAEGTLSGSGSADIYAGAVLTVGENQAAGDYSGSLVVTVAYN